MHIEHPQINVLGNKYPHLVQFLSDSTIHVTALFILCEGTIHLEGLAGFDLAEFLY